MGWKSLKKKEPVRVLSLEKFRLEKEETREQKEMNEILEKFIRHSEQLDW